MSAAGGKGLHDVTLVGAGGEYMDSAVLVEWTVSPGTAVGEGQVLAVVETAKAATEVTAPTAGVVQELLAKPGEEIKVGSVLARIANGAEAPAEAAPAAPMVQAQAREESSGLARRLPKVFASPLAKRIARDRGIDLTGVKGSGPGGRIRRADVEALLPPSATAQPQPQPATATSPAVGEGYRRAMASHMVRAAAIPAFTVGMDIDGGKLLEARARIKQQGGRATLNDLIIAAVARILRHHPRVNAQWDGKGVLFNADINIGVAIATDLGLVVPVVHRADSLGPEAIAQRMAELKVKAQSQRLSPADITGGTFSISNLGSFGVTAFTAALNPPAAAILAVPAFRNVTLFEGGRLETRPVAHFSVTADHRVLDGADVARFLGDLKNGLEGGNVLST
ncbi:dihydrolipoamide acetyltransferase family protein [Rhodoligotrophos defluvii]|uniref:dihydrolipoamide acetyltransferase family protein n=1 Tax=Rhodoligotrophos defluvii TaxID=2561934 RepID=UPI001485ABF2|nr:dihydrolipoamide acetyltransferase family protein [Rhodoligotrophos defluvii]